MIFVAVVLSGALAAMVAVLMTAETPYVTPDYALRDTIIVLVGVVVGGMDRLWTRDARRLRDRLREPGARRLPAEHRQLAVHERRLPRLGRLRRSSSSRCCCGPTACSRGGSTGRWSGYEARSSQLAGPVALIALAGLLGLVPLERARDRVRDRAGLRRDRRRALRLHRQLGRALVRADRLLPRRRLRGRRAVDPAGHEVEHPPERLRV